MSRRADAPAPAVPAAALTYRGGRRFIPGVPARDLTAADLERLVYRARQLKPGDVGFDDALAARIVSLTRSGLFAPPTGEAQNASRGAVAPSGTGEPPTTPETIAAPSEAVSAPADPAPSEPPAEPASDAAAMSAEEHPDG